MIKLYQKTDSGIKCILCPHFCVLSTNQAGKCSVRKSDGEKIYLNNPNQIEALSVGELLLST